MLAIGSWGGLFLKYWLTGKLYLLIHPNYFGLTVVGGIGLIVVALLRLLYLFRGQSASVVGGAQHLNLFPPLISSLLLLVTAIAGLMVEPRAFASPMAAQRGLGESSALTRTRPQAFRSQTVPEDRSLIDWVRTLNVYPEPDAYTGQKVKVQGFVTYPSVSSGLGDRYLGITRFVITCCAADVYPVSLPVKLTQNRAAYPLDRWFEVEGRMITETLGGKRQLVIEAKSLKSIPEPKNPYDY
ncbi:TIGR03943 family protein [Leptolyngbya sp. 'hensonii']|nr:TIGR03943 family protein [Leptolyngbya sp. 'hensonii']